MALSKITSASLSDNAVTTAKVADDAVTNAKIGAGAITNTEVNASAGIVATKLGTLATANMPTGSIIQTVSAELENDNVTSSTSYVDTGLTANITPSSTSSKISVIICIPMNANHANTDVQVTYKVLRDSTALGDAVFGDHSGNGTRSDLWTTAHFAYVDSPNSTSQLTYKVQHHAFNSDIVSTASHQNNKCTIILQEIKG